VATREVLKPVLEVPSVPEVAIAKHGEPIFWEHNVGTSRQPLDVEAVSESPSPKLAPEGQFATRVRLGTGTSRRGRCVCRGWTQPGERGRIRSVLCRHRSIQSPCLDH
jgi:hypothetical protein